MIKGSESSVIKCIFNSSSLSQQGLHFVSIFFSFFFMSFFMVLVLERGVLLGIFGDLLSTVFLSERTIYQSSGRYERMFHQTTFSRRRKDSGHKSLTSLLRLSFERNFCYLFNKKKKSVRFSYFAIYFGKLLKPIL